jgi:pilus assembly protein Flp/PilA
LKDEDGPTAVEYAVMLALIVGACLTSVNYLTQQTRACFDYSSAQIDQAVNGS